MVFGLYPVNTLSRLVLDGNLTHRSDDRRAETGIGKSRHAGDNGCRRGADQA